MEDEVYGRAPHAKAVLTKDAWLLGTKNLQAPRSLEANLTTGPVTRTLFRFCLPTLGSNVLQSLNASVNTIWIGRFLGEQALAASSNANIILFLLLAVVFGVSLAASVLVGQRIGARQLEEARKVVGTSATLFATASIPTAVLGFVFAPALLKWMNTPHDSVALATSYIRTLLIGLPSMFFHQYVMMVLSAGGDAKTPFKFLLWSVSIDIALNPLLIFGVGPISGLGISGSALATVMAQTGTLLALIVQLYRRQHFLCLRGSDLHHLKIDAGTVKLLLTRGTPMGLQVLVVSSSLIAMYTFVNRYGSEVTAAFGAVLQIWTYIQMPAFAVAAAMTAMAAQNIGAERWDRVSKIARAGLGIIALLTGGPIFVLYLINRFVVGLFLPPDAAAASLAAHANTVGLWGFVPFALAYGLLSVPRAAGAVIGPLAIVFVALWLVRVPFVEVLEPYWQLEAVWWSFPVASLMMLTLAWTYYAFGRWRKIGLMAEPR